MLDSFRNTFGEPMTAWEKSVQKRPYRERGQIKRREKLGLLEKHKDYVKRAKNYQTKQKVWENGLPGGENWSSWLSTPCSPHFPCNRD